MQTSTTFESVEAGNIVQDITSESNRSDLQDKIRLSNELIKECLEVSINPVCLCSFGKDSLVLLHLILQVKRIPVIYWREPFYQKKFNHTQEVAELWDLTIYDYPPTYCDYLQIEDYFDVYNFYYVNGQYWINLYTGTRDFKDTDKEYLCAVNDLLSRPKVPSYEFKWDCIFHGQKDIDPIYIAEPQKLKKLQPFGNGLMAYPISEWTNEDIWQYIKENNLPFNKERYENKNENFNNDLFSACHRCLDYKNPETVLCPKAKKIIKNISKGRIKNEEFKNLLLGRK